MTGTDPRWPVRPRRRDAPARPPTRPHADDGDPRDAVAGEDAPADAGAGPPDDVLPPGRRDAEGFWIPDGYESPGDLFTPRQRRAQARQRVLQRSRRSPAPPEDDGAR
jgi:hypothetical protein